MTTRQIACPGGGSKAAAIPSGKNPKVTCFRCNKRVGVTPNGKIKKHMVLARLSGNKPATVLPVR